MMIVELRLLVQEIMGIYSWNKFSFFRLKLNARIGLYLSEVNGKSSNCHEFLNRIYHQIPRVLMDYFDITMIHARDMKAVGSQLHIFIYYLFEIF